MFEKDLSERLGRIFDLKIDKVTFDAPGESAEQETLFIEIERARNFIKDTRQISRVNGKIRIFAQNSKLPYGYFSKKLSEADPEDKVHLFFFDFEENSARFLNIAERTASFVFFFDSQYNPSQGTITSITLQGEAT